MSSYIPNNEHFLRRTRNIRNELLIRTDKFMLLDFPITEDNLLIVKQYRQKLRDFMNENKERILNGEKVEFPAQPDFLNINIIY